MEIEVLLNCRNELLDCMINEGLLRQIGNIFLSETDLLVLVCFLRYFLIITLCIDNHSLFYSVHHLNLCREFLLCYPLYLL